jgi:dTDP-4-dehydrorhamnose reductase
MSRVLIAGATGLLGSSLAPLLHKKGHDVIALGRSQQATISVDLTRADEAVRIIDELRPDVVINLVANTNIDLCESDVNLAYCLNVLPIGNLCQAIANKQFNTHVIHLSSDMVYDGIGPQKESEVILRNSYALSKFTSELIAKNIGGTVLRTNFFGPSRCAGRSSFSDWIYGALLSGNPIDLFEDVFFSPLSMETLCEMISLAVEKRPSGIYNLGSREGMSKADFAFFFASLFDFSIEKMKRVPLAQFNNLKARRPKDMRMNSNLFEEEFNIQLPSLLDEITKTGALYNE